VNVKNRQLYRWNLGTVEVIMNAQYSLYIIKKAPLDLILPLLSHNYLEVKKQFKVLEFHFCSDNPISQNEIHIDSANSLTFFSI